MPANLLRAHPLSLVLTAVNLVTLLLLGRSVAVEAQSNAQVIRGRAFELVDANGQVRSRLNVEDNGEVVLRMLDQSGTIRVKLGAGDDGSGMVLLDDQTEPGLQMLAKPEGPSLRLFGNDSNDLLLTPPSGASQP